MKKILILGFVLLCLCNKMIAQQVVTSNNTLTQLTTDFLIESKNGKFNWLNVSNSFQNKASCKIFHVYTVYNSDRTYAWLYGKCVGGGEELLGEGTVGNIGTPSGGGSSTGGGTSSTPSSGGAGTIGSGGTTTVWTITVNPNPFNAPTNPQNQHTPLSPSGGNNLGNGSGLGPIEPQMDLEDKKPVYDCFNVLNGKAFRDSCKNCVGGTTPWKPCVGDCKGVWGGTAALDSCGKCAGGLSLYLPCNKIPCATDSTIVITSDLLKKINSGGSKNDRDSAAKYLNLYMKDSKFNVNTRLRVAHLLAQIMAETDGFRVKAESFDTIDYPRKKLLKKWPQHFNASNINSYINTEKIFDKIYSNRYTNGPENTKDGSKYRGHGLIQLTWKSTYLEFNTWYHQNFSDRVSLYDNPTLLETNMKYSVLSALWEICIEKKLNNVADDDDIFLYSITINGKIWDKKLNRYKNPNGWEKRKSMLARAKAQFCL